MLGCPSCGSAFVDPLPSPDDFVKMYDQDQYHSQHYQLDEQDTLSTLLPQVRSFLKPGGDLLDFGCGTGFFLKTATEAGFHCEGVELDARTREWAAANSGCEVISLGQAVDEKRRYDIIHLGDVLEHLPDPAATLRQLHELLRPDGSFFLEGPLENNASLVYLFSRANGALKKLLGRPLLAEFPPFHLFRTNARAQRQFLEKTMGYEVRGFVVVEDGWPYKIASDRWSKPRSPGHAVRMAIGNLAVLAAAFARPFGLKLGNRFATVAYPRSSAA
jgi:SAM-dependent methyltransferase